MAVDVDNCCSGRFRPRKDRLVDFSEFVLGVGEVVVLPEVGHMAKSSALSKELQRYGRVGI